MTAPQSLALALPIVVTLGLLAAAPIEAGTSPQKPAGQARAGAATAADRQPAASPKAGAYYQFMLGRELESEGDVAGAIKAYREASRLDPKSAEVVAELAGLFARENRAREAIDTAQAALRIDPANVSAHRVLGIIYAGMARVDEGTGPFDAQSRAAAATAAEHLEAARKASPLPSAGLDMMLARIYIRSDERDKAIVLLGQMVVDEAGNPAPVNLLLQLYEQAGRQADAIRLLESAAGDQPSFYAALGQLYAKERRWRDAARAYEQSLSKNGLKPDVRTDLALADLSTGDPALNGRALELLQQVRRDSPADTRVLYLLSQAQRAAGKLDDAEKTARDLMTIAPGSLTGPYALALVFEQRQLYRRVIDTLAPIVDQRLAGGAPAGPDLGPLLLRLGAAYLQVGEADHAATAFERARAAYPQNPSIDLYVLQARILGRHTAEAVALADTLRASRPDDQQVLRLAADAYRQAGRVDEGEALLTGALARRPGDLSAYFALAGYDAQAGRYAAALRVLDQADAKFPSNVEVLFRIGSVLDQQKRFADAERKFREALATDPLHAPTLNYLGYMLANRGERLDESIGYIRKALEIDPNNGAYLDSLGWAYFRQNRFDLAEQNLQKAAERLPRDSAIQDHLGDVLFKLGRYQDAATAWQRALDGNREQVDTAGIEKKLRTARDKARKP